MNPLIIQGINAVLALIEGLLPVILGSSDKEQHVTNIINALQSWLPIIGTEIGTLYQGIKNIITALKADPATTAAQLVALQALDAQTDQAFEAAVADVDPADAPPPATPPTT